MWYAYEYIHRANNNMNTADADARVGHRYKTRNLWVGQGLHGCTTGDLKQSAVASQSLDTPLIGLSQLTVDIMSAV